MSVLHNWWKSWVSGSVLTRQGRELRRVLRDPVDAEHYVEATRPGVTVEIGEITDEPPEGLHILGGLGATCIRCGERVDNGQRCEATP